MLDNTCYLIGFDKIEYAVYSLILLNSQPSIDFLKSITFKDAKRTFTKDILMRIDFLEIANLIQEEEISNQITFLNEKYNFKLKLDLWDTFLEEMKPINDYQLLLFS